MANSLSANCCCGCDDALITFSAIRPSADDAVTGTAQAMTFSRTVYNWESYAAGGTPTRFFVGSSATHKYRAFFRFGGFGVTNPDVSKVEIVFTVRGAIATPGTNRAIKITAPIVTPTNPSTGEELETLTANVPTITVPSGSLQTNLAVITFDVSAIAAATINESSESEFIFAIKEATGIDGAVIESVQLIVHYSGVAESARSPISQGNFRQRFFETTATVSSSPTVGRVEDSTYTTEYFSVVRIALPNDVRDWGTLTELKLTSSSGVNPKSMNVKGARLDSDFPTSLSQLLQWIDEAPVAQSRADGVPYPIDLGAFATEVTDATQSIVVFLTPKDLGTTTIAGVGFRAKASLKQFVPIGNDVVYDTTEDRWFLRKPFDKAWWSANVTPCDLTVNQNPYRQRWTIALHENDGGIPGDIIATVQIVRQEYSVFLDTFGEPYIDGRANHATFIFDNGDDHFEATIDPELAIDTPIRMTARPSGVLHTIASFQDRFRYDGEWSAAVPNRYVNATTTHGVYMPPLQTSGKVILSFKCEQVDPIDTESPTNEAAGSWTVARTKIKNDDTGGRAECLSPRVCSIKTPDFMTPRWELNCHWISGSGTVRKFELCQTRNDGPREPGLPILLAIWGSGGPVLNEFVFQSPRSNAMYPVGNSLSWEQAVEPYPFYMADSELTTQAIRGDYATCSIVAQDESRFLIEAIANVSIYTDTPQGTNVEQEDPPQKLWIKHDTALPDYGGLSVKYSIYVQNLKDSYLAWFPPRFRYDGALDKFYLEGIDPNESPFVWTRPPDCPIPTIDDRFHIAAAPTPIGQYFTVKWRRWVPKWTGPPPELTFRGSDDDVIEKTPGEFNAVTTWNTLPYLDYRDVQVVEELWSVGGGYLGLHDHGTFGFQEQRYRNDFTAEPFSADDIVLTVQPATDSMPQPIAIEP